MLKLSSFLCGLSLLAATHIGSAANKSKMPDIDLPGITAGEQAVAALGKQLPSVAQAHGLTALELEKVLKHDKSAKLDKKGRLFYTDPAPDTQGATSAGGSIPVAQAYTIDQTFQLHSKPGARLVVFLDFDGFYMAGTAWNNNYNNGQPINCPAWDMDGSPSTFGAEECARIQEVWQRVSEDYASFDVDVTTQDPGDAALTRSSSSDSYYGMRVLVSPISSYFGSYGGIAYVGVFDMAANTYKPALVFPENLGNSAKNIAEACSHECGHTLGLSHDGVVNGDAYYSGHGTGETGWAPIMGVGYYKMLTQWSNGGYPNANNKQDDLAIITGYIPYRADAYGNDRSTSAVLPAGTSFTLDGVIERNSDVDVLRFTAGPGSISANVAPAAVGPNLDIAVEIRDANDLLVAASNPLDALNSTLSVTVNGGTYYLSVRGTGKSDPYGYPSYGSMGAYTVQLTLPAAVGNTPPIASATANPITGTAPLAVSFSSAGSSDPEGGALTYYWTFGDGAVSSEPNPLHTYSSAGAYTATLKVTDNQGAWDDTTVTITVSSGNNPPVALATATPTTGIAPLTVNFDASASYDPEGQALTFTWSFGDGTTATGATATHVYTQPGTYTANVTVSDDVSTATKSLSVQANSTAAPRMRVQAIMLTVTSTRNASAKVVITDPNTGALVSGATVSGSWSGTVTGSGSAVTGSNGEAVFAAKRVKRSGTATFTVTGVTKSGYTYAPSLNVVTKADVQTIQTP